SQAITLAADGDHIVVGPGRYGDVNGNGTLGETGEETGGFGCMLLIYRAVTITSSDGAAATMIDASSVSSIDCNVGIIAAGAEFGKPGQGFTVTNTGKTPSNGIVIDATAVKIRGN